MTHKDNQPPRSRKLRLESLESRELLSVSAAEFATIGKQYAELNLSTNMAEYNVIEIQADQLSESALRSAIDSAAVTLQKELIVCRTTATQNKVSLSGKNLSFDSGLGNIAIVSLGDAKLTLDARNQSMVFWMGNSDVAFGGVRFVNGSNGAIYASGDVTNKPASLRITNCEFLANQTNGYGDGMGGDGGAIMSAGSSLFISNTSFTENRAVSRGGAVYFCGDGDSRLSLVIKDSVFAKNVLRDGVYNVSGGAVSILWAENVDISGTKFLENVSRSEGTYADGGALCIDESTVKITNSIFQGNVADGGWGGGIHAYCSTSTLVNVVLVGNESTGAQGIGGGMSQRGGTATLVNVTITGNSAKEYGAGYYVDGRDGAGNAFTHLRNSIVVGNFGEDYHTSQGGSTKKSNSMTSGNAKFVANPGSIGSKNYGDLRLAAGSSAINAGSDSWVPSGITTDLDGKARFNGKVDMGAYEYQNGTSAAVAPVKPVVKSSTSVGTVTLSWTANAKNAEYVVVCTTHPAVSGKQITVSSTGAVITGLHGGTTYKFSVVAKNSEGQAAPAVVVAAKTKPYAAVKSLKATSGLASVSLRWTASPLSETDGYEVLCYDSTGKNLITTKSISGISNTTATITGLNATTKYSFVVRATSTTLGSKSADAKLTVSTSKYAAVTKLKGTSGLASVSLNWNPSSMPETAGYEIACYDATGKTLLATKSVSGISNTTTTITGLNATTKYVFIVKATASLDGGTIVSTAAKLTVSTSKYAAVSKLKATSTPESLTLTWNRSTLSETDGYEVFCYDSTGKILLKNEKVSGSAVTTATIEGLSAKTKYKLIVRAVSSTLKIQSADAVLVASTLK